MVPRTSDFHAREGPYTVMEIPKLREMRLRLQAKEKAAELIRLRRVLEAKLEGR